MIYSQMKYPVIPNGAKRNEGSRKLACHSEQRKESRNSMRDFSLRLKQQNAPASAF